MATSDNTAATNPSTTTTQVATTPVNPVDMVARDLATAALKAAQVPPVVTMDVSATYNTTTTSSQVGLQFASTQSTFETNLGEKVIDTSLISKIRSKSIYFSAYHLKPLTQLYCFFDNVNVDAYVSTSYRVTVDKVVHTNRSKSFTRTNSNVDVLFAKGTTIYVNQVPIDKTAANGYLAVGNTFSWDGITYTVVTVSQSTTLETDENGYVAGTFLIPNTDETSFNTGSRSFLICDSAVNNAADISTSAEFMYYASGIAQTKQAQTLSTRINQVTINPLLKSEKTQVAGRSAALQAVSAVAPVTVTTDPIHPTIVTYSPSMGATGVSLTGNIVITFSEAITKNTGTITLKKSNGTVIETFAMPGSSLVTTSGSALTINPTADLNQSTSYIVDLPYGCVKNSASYLYEGSSNYSFTTSEPVTTAALVPLSYFPSDGALDIDVKSSASIKFNRAIAKGTGNIVLRTSAGTVETINVATSTNVSISNDTVTILFTNLLSNLTNYFLDFPSTAIKDTAGSPVYWAGTTSYDFTTVSEVKVATVDPISGVATSGSTTGVVKKVTVTDYVLDFTTATGECGIDVTGGFDQYPDAFQIFWDGGKDPVAGSGGTADRPVYLVNTDLTTANKNFLTKLGGGTIQVYDRPVSKTNPLKYRFNKTKAEPTTALLRVSTFAGTEWNQVLPASVTPTTGKAKFKIYATDAAKKAFRPAKMNGITGWDHWDKEHNHVVLDASDTKYTNWAYRDVDNTISYINNGDGFMTFPAGSHSLVYEIENTGTAAGTITGITVTPSNDQLLSPGYGSAWAADITAGVFDMKLAKIGSEKSKTTAVSGFPVTIPAGYELYFTVDIAWPWTFFSPTWNWNTETGLSWPVTVGKVRALPNYADIKLRYKKAVLDEIEKLRTYLLRWEVAPNYTNAEYIPPSADVKMVSNADAIIHKDPLAQTFFVNAAENPDGYFVSSVDLFFKTKSATEDITVQIRPVVNGFPSSTDIVPFATSSLTPDSVNITDYPNTVDNTSYTKFKFDSPIYLAPGTYAIVIISPSKDYQLFTSTIGGFRLNDLDSRISEVSYAGDLFKSSNSETWLPSPYQDLCFVVNRADFKTSGTAIFNSDKPGNNFSSSYNRFIAVTHYNKDDYIRVETSENTDRIYQVMNSGTSGNTAPTHTTGTVTNGTIQLSFLATGTRWQDVDVPYDVYFAQGESVTFKNSEAKHYYKGTDASGIIDTDYKQIMLGSNYELESRKVLNSSTKDLYAKIDLTTNDTKLSPVVDITRLSNVLVRNVVNADTIAPNFVASTYIAAGSYIKVLVGTTYKMYLVINSGTTSTAAPIFVGGDTLNGSALLRYVGDTNNGDTELLPAGGLAASRYMTRKVVLADGFESTDIVVRFNAHTPVGSTVKVYYKAAFVDGNTTLEETPYHEMVLSERAANYAGAFVEHKFICDYGDNILPGVRYALPNKQRFNQFSVKIVMLSANTVIVPKVRDLRVIALDD